MSECEEMRFVAGITLQCKMPATKIIHSDTDKKDYNMCDECAWHSIKNRGMTLVKELKECT